MWEKMMKPFMAVMSRAKYKQKFVLISLLFMLPIVFLDLSWNITKQKEISQLVSEQHGLEQLTEIWPLALQIQQHRGMVNGYLNGNTSSEAQLETKKEEINQMILNIGQSFDESKHPEGYAAWNEAVQKWKDLSAQYTSMDAPSSFTAHSELVEDILGIVRIVSDESTLTLDTNIESFYMIDLLVNDLPQLVEYTAIIRGKGNGVLSSGTLNATVESELRILEKVAEENIKEINSSLVRLSDLDTNQHNQLIEQLFHIGELAKNYLTVLNEEVLEAEQLTMSPDEYFNQGTDMITKMNELITQLKSTVADDLQKRESSLKLYMTIINGILVLAGILIVLMYIAFYRNVIHAVKALKQSAEAMAAGDFSQPVHLQTRDELNEISTAFNKMQASVSKVLNSNQHMALTVLEASDGLAAVARDSAEAMKQVAESVQVVSEGTTSQKRTTRDSSIAMNEMALGVNRIAEAASEVAHVAVLTNEQAMTGSEQLEQSVEQMDNIKRSQERSADIVSRLDQHSAQIGQIISFILDLSSQTKLLSLNASIEAARAGEHGRGFAVVAKEVGSLAEQSARSSAEISKLLEEVSTLVKETVESMKAMSIETDAGIQSIHRSKETLDEIINGIRLVSEQIQEVSATSEEMSAEMEEVTASIAEIAVISEQSANEAETMAAAAEEQLAATEQIQGSAQTLQELSVKLQSDLSKFKLLSAK